MWDIEVKHRWFRDPVYYVGWRNLAGFGPIADFNNLDDAEAYLRAL